MADWSRVPLSKVKETWRLDAEYWNPEFLQNNDIIQKGATKKGYAVRSVYDLVRSIKGSAFYPTFVNYYSDRGMPFIRVADIGDFFLKEDKIVRIDPDVIRQYHQISVMSEGDIVLSKGGSIGEVALIQEGLGQCALCRDAIALKSDESLISPLYLTAFLKSRFGQLQLNRNKSQQVQSHLTFPAVGEIQVLVPPRSVQDEIASLVAGAYKKRQGSATLYTKAESLLLSELGLGKLDLSPTLFYERSFGEAQQAVRLDAEFFQPQYHRVLKALESTKPKQIVPLGAFLALLTNGHTPLHHDLSEGDVPFLTAEHVFDFRIDYSSEKRILRGHHDGELKQTRLRKGDCLISIKGRIGNAAIAEDLPGPVNINQDVALLRLKDGLPPYYLMAYLNSQVGQAFTLQYCTGQINPFLGLGNIRLLPIPIYDHYRMQQIASKTEATVLKARAARDESRRLLEEAKLMVEEAVLGGSH